LNIQALDDAVGDAVGLADFREVHAFGMDKNHIARPQSEKLRSAESLFAVNLHERIVFARSAGVKRDAITTSRSQLGTVGTQ
jgi:hypothetical protein